MLKGDLIYRYYFTYHSHSFPWSVILPCYIIFVLKGKDSIEAIFFFITFSFQKNTATRMQAVDDACFSFASILRDPISEYHAASYAVCLSPAHIV